MKRTLLTLVLLSFLTIAFAGNSPYPIIFVHGLGDSDICFHDFMYWLNSKYGNDPEDIKVFDAILNADNSNDSAVLANDVRYTPFVVQEDNEVYAIYPGKRMFSWSVDDYSLYWIGESNVFAINFDSQRISGTLGQVCDLSNEAALHKQGYALGKMIQQVLNYTGAEKVILVGHSMGGLAIREYLQRAENGIYTNSHPWWVNPTDTENGHKVARVVTLGSPHGGSNLLELQLRLPNMLSEGVRDLRIGHNFPGAEDILNPYLYTGSEELWDAAFTFPNHYNYDINCNGSEIDIIDGINVGNGESEPSITMHLPENILYTYITVDADFTDGDGVVEETRQWLHDSDNEIKPVGISDRVSYFKLGYNWATRWQAHTSEPEDTLFIIMGMDEPDTGSFAYQVESNKWYSGFITYQPNGSTMDIDFYKMEIASPSIITCEIWTNQTGLHHAYFTDEDFIIVHDPVILSEGQNIITFDVSQGPIYIKLVGDAYGDFIEGNESTDDAYDFYITTSTISMTADFHASPVAGNINTTFHFYDDSVAQNTSITTWQWDFNGDGEVESTEQNPQWTYDNPGIYNVILRVTDGSGAPGNDGIHADYEMKLNYITVNGLPSSDESEIIWVEYFIDTDPGFFNGTPLYMIPASDVTINANINIGNLSEGLHRLYVRAYDDSSRWGLPQCKPFIVQSTSPQVPLPDVTQMEYFIDDEVNPGNGNSITFTPGADVTSNTDVQLSGLSDGLHRLYVRARNANGRWGLPQCKPFIVQQTSPQTPLPNIVQMEYFFDYNVGPGGGIDIAIPASQDVTTTASVSLGYMDEGLHRMYVRAKDEHGRWGLPQCKPFIVQQTSPQTPLPTITQLEYFYDTDPGMGQGSIIDVIPSVDDVTVNASLLVDQLTLGDHRLYFRAKDSLNRWGLPQSMDFQLVILPDTPPNVEIDYAGGILSISWDPVTDVTGYKVYASDNPSTDFTDVTSTGSIVSASRITWSTSNVTPGKRFYYVKSYNQDARDGDITLKERKNINKLHK